MTYQILDCRKEIPNSIESTDACFIVVDSVSDMPQVDLAKRVLNIVIPTEEITVKGYRNIHAMCRLSENRIDDFIKTILEIGNTENEISLSWYDIKTFLKLQGDTVNQIYFCNQLPDQEIACRSGVAFIQGFDHDTAEFTEVLKQIKNFFKGAEDYAYALKNQAQKQSPWCL